MSNEGAGLMYALLDSLLLPCGLIVLCLMVGLLLAELLQAALNRPKKRKNPLSQFSVPLEKKHDE